MSEGENEFEITLTYEKYKNNYHCVNCGQDYDIKGECPVCGYCSPGPDYYSNSREQ